MWLRGRKRLLAGVCVVLGIVAKSAAGAEVTAGRVVVGGELDRTFGVAGRAVAPPRLEAVYAAVALRGDGKIVVVGNGGFAGSDGIVRAPGIALLRFTTEGVPDAGFGEGGVVVTSLPDRRLYAFAVALTGTGAIVVAGRAVGAQGGGSDVAVLRFTPDGVLDASFAGGVVTTHLGSYAGAQSVVVQDDGRIVVATITEALDIASSKERGAALVGYDAAGALDATFGANGVARVEGVAPDGSTRAIVRIAPDGSLVVAVSPARAGNVETVVMRFDHDGHAPRAFAATAALVQSIAVGREGAVVGNGFMRAGDMGDAVAVLLRWGVDGALDAGFGAGGVRAMDEHAVPGNAIAIDGRDRVLLAGDFLLRRLPDGAADPSFGIGGEAHAVALEQFHDVVLQPDGKIIAVGGGYQHAGPLGAVAHGNLARYESDASRLCGDADASETVTVSDGVAVLRAAAGLDGPCASAVCDADGNGMLGVTDGVVTLRAAAGLSSAGLCGAP